MKIKILSKESNPLLKRKEVTFELNHNDEGETSPRRAVKENLANMLKTRPDLVILRKLETKTGTRLASGEANVYESVEQARQIEPQHIIARNAPPEPEEKKKDVEEPKAKEPTAPQENPEKADLKEKGGEKGEEK